MSFTVRFLPENRTWQSEERVDLGFAAGQCQLMLEQPCGSKATCGKCRVRVVEGRAAAGAADKRVLGDDLTAQGWRLGCQLKLEHDVVIEIPRSARTVPPKTFGDATLLLEGFQPLDAQSELGVAIDVGSTTLAVAIVQLASGDVLANSSALNPQVRFGADVVTRIAHAHNGPGAVRELHDVLIDALNDLIAHTAREARVAAEDVGSVVCVGNPTMMHMVLGLDPTPLGEAPYRGELEDGWNGNSADVGLMLGANARAYIPPGVRSHVGADTMAALLAMKLDQVEQPTLLIDLGTNSEVVLALSDQLFCASTAAGPAFEGANIHHGMRGVAGAIEEVRVLDSGKIVTRTIAGAEPRGICGSGLIDAVAELLRSGAIDPSGRMRRPAVSLARTSQQSILLTAADVRQLQLVKASIRAGVSLLLQRAGVPANELNAVFLAGTFGNYLRKASALAIGMLPSIDPERIRFVGNAAGAGARLLLVDQRARDRAQRAAAGASYVELGGLEEFTAAFVEEMAFPIPEQAA